VAKEKSVSIRAEDAIGVFYRKKMFLIVRCEFKLSKCERGSSKYFKGAEADRQKHVKQPKCQTKV